MWTHLIDQKYSAIIVEGPDCAGKTTLCEKLSKELNYEVIHLTYYKNEEKMRKQFEDAYKRLMLGNVIIDRYILSNIYYGIAFHNARTLYTINDLLNILPDTSAMIVCLPEKDVWERNFIKCCNEREEMYTDIKGMRRVYELYAGSLRRGFYSKLRKFDVYRFDFNNTLQLRKVN